MDVTLLCMSRNHRMCSGYVNEPTRPCLCECHNTDWEEHVADEVEGPTASR
jgi:hypothetical protein